MIECNVQGTDEAKCEGPILTREMTGIWTRLARGWREATSNLLVLRII